MRLLVLVDIRAPGQYDRIGIGGDPVFAETELVEAVRVDHVVIERFEQAFLAADCAFIRPYMHHIPGRGTGLNLHAYGSQTVMLLLAQFDAGSIRGRLPDRLAKVRLQIAAEPGNRECWAGRKCGGRRNKHGRADEAGRFMP